MLSTDYVKTAQRAQIRDTAASVDEITLGTGPLGNMFVAISDETAEETVAACIASGIHTFDTAPHYGLGLAEHRLGHALRKNAAGFKPVIVSKAGRALDPAPEGWEGEPNEHFKVAPTHKRRWDFTRKGIRETLEGSLARLGLDRLSILLLHDPETHMEEALTEGLPALLDLKRAGLVDAIGVGTKHTPTLTRFIETGDVDVALMAGRFSLLEQGALDDVLPAAQKHGTSILAAGVFNSGILARHEVPKAVTYEYRQASEDILERARRIASVCERFGTTLPAAAVAYPAAHPSIVSRVIGAGSAAEITADIGYLQEAFSPQLWETLRSEGLLRPDAPIPTR